MAEQVSLSPAFQSAYDFLEKCTTKVSWLSYVAMAILPVLITVDVCCRMFGFSVPGSLELQENLLALTTFSFMAVLQLHDRHMMIDFIYERMSTGLKRWCDMTVATLVLGVMVLLTTESYDAFLSKFGTQSMELYVPLEFYYWMPVVGLGITSIVALFQFLRESVKCLSGRHYIPFVLGIAFAFALAYLPFWYRESPYEISNLILGLIAFGLLFLFLFIRMPIAWAMSIIGAMGMVAVSRNVVAALAAVGTTPYAASANYNLVALPLFVLMGCMILYSGISVDLFNSANKWIGHMPGGMGMAGVAGCTGFAAVCGDSLSTAVTMGSVSLPEMMRLKYSPSLATGALAAGGTLGILIPPSSGFIIYGIVTEVSIGRLFMAGLVPGIMLALMFMAYIYYMAVRHPELAPRGPKYTLAEKIQSSMGLVPILALFVLVLGSIVAGICSPNEGGGIGAMGAFLYALVRRKVTKQNLLASLHETGELTARIMGIMVGVAVLGYFFAATRLPFLLADFIVSLPFNRYWVFAIIVVIYVILGCMMNVIPMLMLTLPSIFPTVVALGFDPVWFGVVSVMIMEMGQITPPVGVVVFALAGVAKGIPIETIFKGIIPFVGLMILAVVLITFFPDIALWLPYTLMGPEVL